MREVIYTIAEHAAGAASVTAPSRGQQPPKPCLSPGDYGNDDEYKQAANAAAWQARNSVAQKFLRQRELNPGAAKSFLSKYFRASQQFEVALTDADTGHGLSQEEMDRALLEDYRGRASNAFPQDPHAEAQLARLSGAVRGAGAAPLRNMG